MGSDDSDLGGGKAWKTGSAAVSAVSVPASPDNVRAAPPPPKSVVAATAVTVRVLAARGKVIFCQNSAAIPGP